jgi:hypothetical protein
MEVMMALFHLSMRTVYIIVAETIIISLTLTYTWMKGHQYDMWGLAFMKSIVCGDIE